MVFTAQDPPVLGIGFAAFRDVGTFFKTAKADDGGTANPLADQVQWSIGVEMFGEGQAWVGRVCGVGMGSGSGQGLTSYENDEVVRETPARSSNDDRAVRAAVAS